MVKLIEELRELGPVLSRRGARRRRRGPLAGKTLVLTGSLPEWFARGCDGGGVMGRRRGRVTGSVVEEDRLRGRGRRGPGSKLEKAERLGVPVLDEAGPAPAARAVVPRDLSADASRRSSRRPAGGRKRCPWLRLATRLCRSSWVHRADRRGRSPDGWGGGKQPRLSAQAGPRARSEGSSGSSNEKTTEAEVKEIAEHESTPEDREQGARNRPKRGAAGSDAGAGTGTPAGTQLSPRGQPRRTDRRGSS